MNGQDDPIPGELPRSWRLTTIGKLCDENGGEVQTGPFGSQLHAEDYVSDGIPSVMPKDIVDDRISTESVARVSEKDAARLAVHRLRAGDIIYARRGDIGRRALVTRTEDGWLCGTGCLRIRMGTADVAPDYLLAYLGHPAVRAWVESKAQGATMLNLNTSILRAVPVRVPPPLEQRRIADILDKADGIRRKRKEAIALAEELLRSAFLELFGDPVANPKGWPTKLLGDVLADIESGWSPVCQTRPTSEGEWGVLKLGAVTTGRFIASENKAMEPDTAPVPELEVKPGDVLFARKNTYEHVAACVLVHEGPPRLMLPDLLFRLVPTASAPLRSATLWGILSHPGKRKQVQGLAGGTAGSMPNISKARLRGVEVPVPPKDLQAQFEKVVTACTALRGRAAIALREADELFGALVAGAFRGELSKTSHRQLSLLEVG